MATQNSIRFPRDLSHLPDRIAKAFVGWDGGLGAIDGRDATFLYNLIRIIRPNTLVEIGTASGFSSALMAMMLEDQGLNEARLASYDLASRFFLDRSKPLGFMKDELAGPAASLVSVHPGHTSLSATGLYKNGAIDVSFIDANHRHPWPLIDALMLLPRMAKHGVMVFHDPMAIRLASNRLGIGPKVVRDSAPQTAVVHTRSLLPDGDIQTPTRRVEDNIFGLSCEADTASMGIDLSDGFLIPWTLSNKMDLSSVMTIAAFLSKHYPGDVGEKFRWAAERHFATAWA